VIPIRVSRLVENDIIPLLDIVDENTAKLTNLTCPFTLLAAHNFIKLYNTYGIKLNTGELIGAVELKPSGETAYLVAENWRKKGVCTEALKLVKRIARKQNIQTIWCKVDNNNIPSIRAAKKAGIQIRN